MPDKPLCIDLFCGLSQAQLSLRANSSVKEFMTCRTKNPDHMALTIFHLPMSVHAPKLWPVRDLDNSSFSARFASSWKAGILPIYALCESSTTRSSGIVDRLYRWLAAVKLPSLPFSGFLRAAFGAVPAIRIGCRDSKVLPAYFAVSTQRYYRLLAPSDAPYSRLTAKRAIKLVWASGLKLCPARNAEQVVCHV